jgi:hypothetical protein
VLTDNLVGMGATIWHTAMSDGTGSPNILVYYVTALKSVVQTTTVNYRNIRSWY